MIIGMHITSIYDLLGIFFEFHEIPHFYPILIFHGWITHDGGYDNLVFFV